MRLLDIILYPFSLLYGFGMMVRNLLFDIGILPSVRFEKAVISVGNLSMGGTGKTPHIEYLIRLLSPEYFLAALSRGYGRESEGFLIGSRRSKVKYIGDEPLQLIRKFDSIKVAVDENRKRGISNLFRKYDNLKIVLLDDAFQHRWVKPGLSILLTSYSRLYYEDHVVPSGTLREFRAGAKRADIIIVTKTPKVFSPISRRRIIEDLAPTRNQQIFFSYITYGDPLPVLDSGDPWMPKKLVSILLLTGIADHSQMQEHLERLCSDLIILRYRDHHIYTEADISKINTCFKDIPTQKKIIMTTEKDMMRLKTTELTPLIRHLPLYYLPISIGFHGNDKEEFDKQVLSFVERFQTSH
jgi:tetraacyldisaccharide 4'-kinase